MIIVAVHYCNIAIILNYCSVLFLGHSHLQYLVAGSVQILEEETVWEREYVNDIIDDWGSPQHRCMVGL